MSTGEFEESAMEASFVDYMEPDEDLAEPPVTAEAVARVAIPALETEPAKALAAFGIGDKVRVPLGRGEVHVIVGKVYENLAHARRESPKSFDSILSTAAGGGDPNGRFYYAEVANGTRQAVGFAEAHGELMHRSAALAPVVRGPTPIGKVEACARAAHEVNRVYCLALGDASHAPWEASPGWVRTSAMQGVEGALAGATPEESHQNWRAHKAAEGWVYGPEKDPTRKTHPCMVDYADLPEDQRKKDELYLAVVRAVAAVLNK